jgi:hypothetical protein
MNPHIILSRVLSTLYSSGVQNLRDLSRLREARELVVFVVPSLPLVNGGVMSIFSLCRQTREIYPQAHCLIVTRPGFYTHAANKLFQNDEKIHRWKQIVTQARRVRKMVLHLPEYDASIFPGDLDPQSVAFLKAIPELHINILNQNIECMPESAALDGLRELTVNLTQTTAHDRYATQAVCDRWGIPTHHFSVHIDRSQYSALPFERKTKTLVLSPDPNPFKEQILARLREGLPDYRQVVVQGLTFDRYMDLVSSSRFSLTFGEGFDAYFCDPFEVGGLGLAVYNDEFFPDASWLELRNVYRNIQDLLDRVVDDIRFLEKNPQEYDRLSALALGKIHSLYGLEKFKDNLTRFYAGRYDFLPRTPGAGPSPGAGARDSSGQE